MLNVLNVKLRVLSPSWVDARPPALAPRLMSFFMLLNGVFIISRPATLNASPYSPTPYFSSRLFLLSFHV